MDGPYQNLHPRYKFVQIRMRMLISVRITSRFCQSGVVRTAR